MTQATGARGRDTPSTEELAVPATRAARPWGQLPKLAPHQWRVLGVVGTATLVANYGMSLLVLALPQIQAGLHIGEADIGGLTAIVRLGVIPAFFVGALADHYGRRRLLLATIVGMTILTGATAFTQDAAQFAVVQVVARVFMDAEVMLGIVVVAEELDADVRGWGIGVIGAFGALGHGVGALLFAVINRLPFGWRALFAAGVLPLLLLAWLRRSLSETRRFERHRETAARGGDWLVVLQPFRNLVRMYPGRLLALCGALLPMSFIIDTAMVFVSKSLQEVHGYSPTQVAVLFLTMGALAPIGNVFAGRLADALGRKSVIIVSLVANTLSIALFYTVRGFWLPPIFGVMLLTMTMAVILFAALGSELFPTSYRSTASGVRWMVAALGGAVGLVVEGRLYGIVGSHARAITWMLLVSPLAPLVVGWFLPETANQELEEISPEK